jgi:hypothetical protein
MLYHILFLYQRLEALIEREWLHGGHPFADRCAKSAFAVSRNRTESPVFLLFLDSIWQIWQQFPCSFEFNEDFIITLFKHAYASQFGELTFCSVGIFVLIYNLQGHSFATMSETERFTT